MLPLCSFPPAGTAVDLAVSGGADSMAMLLLAAAHGLRVTAHHVDHGLRAASHRDIEVIEPVARRLGADVVRHRVELSPGANLEARAREARYATMPAGVMTAHTADDQAETVLINLLRGAGTSGLAAMRPDECHPLLKVRRADTELVCAEAGIAPVVDDTNFDPAFVRNRVRHAVLPLLCDVAGRDIVPLLVRTADRARADDDHLTLQATELDVTDARALAAAPVAVASRAIRLWLNDPYPPDSATVERVLQVARGETPACDVGRMRQVRRSRQRLQLRIVE